MPFGALTAPLKLRKPILLAVGFFVAGIVVARWLQPPMWAAVVGLLGLLIASALACYLRHQAFVLILWGLVFVLGSLYCLLAYYPQADDVVQTVPTPARVDFIGTVLTSPHQTGGGRSMHYVLQVQKACLAELSDRDRKPDGMLNEMEDAPPAFQACTGKVWVSSFAGSAFPDVGDTIRVRGKLVRPREYRVSGRAGSGWSSYLAHQGIWVQLYAQEAILIESGAPAFYQRWASLTRNKIAAVLERGLRPPSSSIVEAMTLGMRERLSPDLLAAFQTTGTAHVLVVSGLHVGLILLALFVFLRLIGLSVRMAVLVAVPVMLVYVWLTGLRMPALRASLMACIGVVSYLMDRRVRGTVVVALAAFIILLSNPLALFAVSFQLSFAAVVGIVYLGPYFLRRLRRLPAPLRTALSVSTAAELAILPLLALYFGQLPLIGFLSNLIVVPLMSILAVVSFVAIGIGLVSLIGAWPLLVLTDRLAGGLVQLILQLSRWASAADLVWLSPPVDAPPLWLVGVYYVLLFALPLTVQRSGPHDHTQTRSKGASRGRLHLPWS